MLVICSYKIVFAIDFNELLVLCTFLSMISVNLTAIDLHHVNREPSEFVFISTCCVDFQVFFIRIFIHFVTTGT